jgi:hypothetical protein
LKVNQNQPHEDKASRTFFNGSLFRVATQQRFGAPSASTPAFTFTLDFTPAFKNTLLLYFLIKNTMLPHFGVCKYARSIWKATKNSRTKTRRATGSSTEVCFVL